MSANPPSQTADGSAESSAGLANESLAISVGTAASRITGAGRIVVGAAVLGPTIIGDLFLAVNILPLVLVGILGGPAVTSVLVPPLVRRLAQDPADADRLVSAVLGLVITVLGSVSVVLVLGRTWLARLFVGGAAPAERDRAIEIAADLLAFMLPQLVIYGMIAVLVATQHARQRFLVPSFAPTVENVVLIAALFAIAPSLDAEDASDKSVLLLILGSSVALLAHLAIQWWGARRAGARFGTTVPWGGRLDGLDEMAGPTRYSMVWTGANGFVQFGMIVIAGYAALGGIQAMEIAVLVAILPAAVVGYPIAAAVLPRLARDNPSAPDAAQAVTDGSLVAMWALVPFGIAMLAFARPIAEALSFGRFEDQMAIDLTTMAIRGLSALSITSSLFEISRQATMAWGELAGLARSIWVSTLVAIGGFVLAFLLTDGPTMLLVIGIGISLSSLLGLVVLCRPMFAEAQIDRHRVRVEISRVLTAALAALVAGLAAQWLIGQVTGNPLVAIVVIGVCFLIVFVAASRGGRAVRALISDLESVGT